MVQGSGIRVHEGSGIKGWGLGFMVRVDGDHNLGLINTWSHRHSIGSNGSNGSPPCFKWSREYSAGLKVEDVGCTGVPRL
jgi:hypothetical protein